MVVVHSSLLIRLDIEPYTSPRWHTFLNDASNEYGDVGGMSSLPAGGDQRTFN